MNDVKNSNEMPRRQFVALSALGTAGLLAGGSPAVGAGPLPGDPAPGSCPTPPPPGGANPCPPAQLQSLCGSPSDNDPLWRDVQSCTQGTPGPNCLNVTSNYVVLHGRPQTTHNYLLLPSCRIKGIECPFIYDPAAANYWSAAWENARSGGSVPVQYSDIGLGINSQATRRFNQLHIHMAGVRASTQRRLQDLESMNRIATQPSRWDLPQYRVAVTGSGGDRTYRALRLPNLQQNLFTLVHQHVVAPNNLAMANQTLIVVPKMTATGFAGAFYILSSDSTDTSLPNGTSTCDHLLVYN